MVRSPRRHPLIAGTLVTSLGTLVCRVLGMLRGTATAWLLGGSVSPVADAFLFAFRIPNLFRELFGEGALTASYLPVLTAEMEKDSRSAGQLATVVVTLLAAALTVVVALGEVACGLIWLVWGDRPGVGLLLGLSAAMLPYLLFVCIAAQLSTMLYVARHFTAPAFVPAVLNIVWLIAACLVAPWLAPNKPAQAYVLAAGVIVAGILQVLAQLPALRRLGFRFDYHWPAAREGLMQVIRNMAPMVAGLAVTQINTLLSSLIAWGMTAAAGGPQLISWLGGIRYPMQQGAVAAMSYGSQLYEFPLGIVGSAVAIAIFPLLSRHAVRGDFRRLSRDMTLGLRLVVCLGVPAGMGLIVLAEPIARLLFERGQFLPADTVRTAWMIRMYATGVWAYCASPVLVRGFYALNDRMTPVRVAVGVVGLNLVLNLSLIWPLAEAGLALSTAVAAGVQSVLLVAIFSRRRARLDWRQLSLTVGRTLASTVLMAAAVMISLPRMPAGERLMSQVVRVGVPLALGIAVYCGSYWLLGGRELSMLIGRQSGEEPEDGGP